MFCADKWCRRPVAFSVSSKSQTTAPADTYSDPNIYDTIGSNEAICSRIGVGHALFIDKVKDALQEKWLRKEEAAIAESGQYAR